MRVPFFALLLPALGFVVFAAGPALRATEAGWIPLGPEAGQRVSSLAVLPGPPSSVVAGAATGVFRTPAGATGWDPVNGEGLPTGVTGELHAAGERLYLATPEPALVEGVFRSDDGGASWTRVRERTGLLAVSPDDPSTVHLATEEGLETSRDGGDTWQQAAPYPRADLVELGGLDALAAAPSEPDTLYVAAGFSGVDQVPFELLILRSDDAGATWEAIEVADLGGGRVKDLVVHPREPDLLYLAGSAGVQRSTDGGRTWEARSQGLPSAPAGSGARFPVLALAIDPVTPDVLHAAFEARPTEGVPGGVFRSSDAGATWAPVHEGLPMPTTVHAIALDSTEPTTLLLGTPTGVFRSSGGGEWSRLPRQLPTPASSVAVHPQEPSRVFAGGDQNRLFVSGDGGDRWRLTGDELPAPRFDLQENPVSVLEISPADPSVLFAHGSFQGIGRSVDGGETWRLVETPPFTDVQELLPDARDPERVLAAVSRAGGVFESADLGETWDRILPGRIRSLAQAPSDPDVLYAGSEVREAPPGHAEGVCRSPDGGGEWECSLAGLADGSRLTALAVSPRDASVVLAAQAGPGGPPVVKSLDGGATWEPAGRGVPDGAFVTDLVFEPADPEVVWAATLRGDGVLRSADEGETWTAVRRGVTDLDVWDLAVDPGGRVLLAATDGGVFRFSTAAGPAPPAGIDWLADPAVPGFRFKVRIDRGASGALGGTREPDCIPETLCVSGAVPGRSEALLRIVGPKPNGRLWPHLVKFSTSRMEIWVQQVSTGEVRYYELPGASPGFDELPGLFDRRGFLPD
ncbi:MAG: WD40/YVTN/BNR-like repeat-containing protein [Thermoanaerobaculia bacterium]